MDNKRPRHKIDDSQSTLDHKDSIIAGANTLDLLFVVSQSGQMMFSHTTCKATGGEKKKVAAAFELFEFATPALACARCSAVVARRRLNAIPTLRLVVIESRDLLS